MALKSQKSKLKTQNYGFTLIEILVVFGILALIGGVTSDLFVSVLKGANKANTINEIKQTGSFVLSYMDRVIRNSSAVVNSASDELVLQDQESGECIRFKFYEAVDGISNGHIGYISAPSCLYDNLGLFDETTFPLGTEKSLTNEDTVSGVSLTSGSFQVSKSGGRPSTISIGFTLSQGEKASSRNEFKAAEVFQTMVSLRNY